MTSITSTGTVGNELLHDEKIHSAFNSIVEQVAAYSAQITDTRPANLDIADDFKAMLFEAGKIKGRPLMYPSISSGVGNGALCEMADGSVKWDMLTGIGVHFLGHSNPKVIKAQLDAALLDTTKHGNLQTSFDAVTFGQRLVKHASKSSKLAHAFITTSGAMANESAIKVCYQKHAPASRVLAFENCFMGRSVTMAQIGDSAGGRQGVPLSTLVDYVPFWNKDRADAMGGATKFIDYTIKRLERYNTRYAGQISTFIFELVQGEGGFNVSNPDYLKALMEFCRANRIAVWADEIQSFGRTEQMFAYEYYGLGEYIDVLTVGKMTQACATMFTEEYNPKPGLLSGTFTGATVDFTVGNVLLDELASEGNYGPEGKFAQHQREFRKQVDALVAKHPDWFPETEGIDGFAGGVGGMMRFTPFGGNKAKIGKICRTAYDEGVICFYCGHGPFHVRMLPPLPVMKMEDWPRVFECLERAMAKVASGS
ncbi:MAG: aminotransferase class III-fold pyridoxal phosphate-dependent enzyme [Phycisphaerales bacterium]|nr:aminotransferase class III-fold pyridoxal phosphate-dependent enzyme [Phycisphaerales bacterium]